MSKLVVCFSLTGNTKFIAEVLAKNIGADILELKPKKEDKGDGLLKMFWRGKQAVTKECPELLPMEKNPDDYNLIIIGTPVWASTLSPVVRTFLTTTNLKNKKIGLFCCHGGAIGQTLKNMAALATGAQIISEIDFIDPLHNDEQNSLARALKWSEQFNNL